MCLSVPGIAVTFTLLTAALNSVNWKPENLVFRLVSQASLCLPHSRLPSTVLFPTLLAVTVSISPRFSLFLQCTGYRYKTNTVSLLKDVKTAILCKIRVPNSVQLTPCLIDEVNKIYKYVCVRPASTFVWCHRLFRIYETFSPHFIVSYELCQVMR